MNKIFYYLICALSCCLFASQYKYYDGVDKNTPIEQRAQIVPVLVTITMIDGNDAGLLSDSKILVLKPGEHTITGFYSSERMEFGKTIKTSTLNSTITVNLDAGRQYCFSGIEKSGEVELFLKPGLKITDESKTSSFQNKMKSLIQSAKAPNFMHIHNNPIVGDYALQRLKFKWIEMMNHFEIIDKKGDIYTVKYTPYTTSKMLSAMNCYFFSLYVYADGQVLAAFIHDKEDEANNFQIDVAGPDDPGYVSAASPVDTADKSFSGAVKKIAKVADGKISVKVPAGEFDVNAEYIKYNVFNQQGVVSGEGRYVFTHDDVKFLVVRSFLINDGMTMDLIEQGCKTGKINAPAAQTSENAGTSSDQAAAAPFINQEQSADSYPQKKTKSDLSAKSVKNNRNSDSINTTGQGRKSSDLWPVIKRNTLLASGSFSLSAAGIISGYALLSSARGLHTEYLNTYDSDSAEQMGNKIDSRKSSADAFFYAAESSLIIGSGFVLWGIIDIIRYRKNKTAGVSARDIVPSISIGKKHYAAQIVLKF